MGRPPLKEDAGIPPGRSSRPPRQDNWAFFPSDVTPAQTMTEGGFCLLKRVLSCTGMSSFFLDKTRSF
ncbi:Hypothetical protein FKW44_012903 [Caligus rogercresseyi]|uniref:Uncharacterized protein n=1 Tax=Caligus rogercresseyi TaxID=217165 RepID=A0A7T8HK05_CALRO|nr:Hypothetical protein FKW44_012903 [Caligus rogercresseyi]